MDDLGSKPLHEYLREHAQRHPDRAAIIWYGRTITYAELDEWSGRVGAVFQNWGVHSGDRVALYMGNCPQYLMAFLGAQKLGAVVSPVSPSFKSWELEYQLQDSGAKVLVADRRLLAQWLPGRQAFPDMHVLVSDYQDFLPDHTPLKGPFPLGDIPTDLPPLSEAEEWHRVVPSAPQAPILLSVPMDHVSLMMYTSGSTGMPKGAMLTFENAWFKAAAGSEANGIDSEDILLTVMPLSHIAGLLMGLSVPIYLGATQVLLHQFNPETVIQAVETYQCSFWYSVAPMNRAVLDRLDYGDTRMRPLRHNLCTSFGIPLTATLAREWTCKTGSIIHEAAYGLTETHTADTYMPVDDVRWGSVGKPVGDTVLRIVDPDSGRDARPGEAGEIWVKNPGVFKGYWNQAEASQRALHEGYVLTGDIGHLDPDGYLYFHGRLKEMIKVSGYSVFPEDVEALLIRHPSIQQVAVAGQIHPYRGEVVKAFVVLRQGAVLTPAALIEWAQDHMAYYKVPREVEIVPSLPVSSTGKVMRRLLVDGSQSGKA